MKRKRAKQDRLLYVFVLLIALSPLASMMLYVLGFNLGFVGFVISIPLIVLGLVLLLLKYLLSHRNEIRSDKDYALSDDGEIVEVSDDEKRKRGADSTVE